MIKILKLYLVLTFSIFCLLLNSSFAAKIKVAAETLDNFSIYNPTHKMKMRILQDIPLKSGEILQESGIFVGNIIDIEPAKRGKRNGYLIFQLTGYITPTNHLLEIKNPDAIAKIVEYKEINIKETALSTGTTVAGLFIKNINYPINFARGVISPYNGKSRLFSGLQKTYESSFLSYISKGQDVELSKGEKIILIFKTKK